MILRQIPSCCSLLMLLIRYEVQFSIMATVYDVCTYCDNSWVFGRTSLPLYFLSWTYYSSLWSWDDLIALIFVCYWLVRNILEAHFSLVCVCVCACSMTYLPSFTSEAQMQHSCWQCGLLSLLMLTDVWGFDEEAVKALKMMEPEQLMTTDAEKHLLILLNSSSNLLSMTHQAVQVVIYTVHPEYKK